MITFENACKRMYDRYRAWGYPGINGAGDVGNEWIFLQGAGVPEEEYPIGPKPIFFNKMTGRQRVFEFGNPEDMKLLKEAVKLTVPAEYYAD